MTAKASTRYYAVSREDSGSNNKKLLRGKVANLSEVSQFGIYTTSNVNTSSKVYISHLYNIHQDLPPINGDTDGKINRYT